MAYRSTDAPASKLDLARGAVASLAWLVLRQRDAVGLATLSGSLHHVLPPSTQASHLDQIGHLLREATPTGPTALGIALDDLANRITRRSLVILISDLFDDLDRLTAGLKHLAWRGHDVAVLQVIDPADTGRKYFTRRSTVTSERPAWSASCTSSCNSRAYAIPVSMSDAMTPPCMSPTGLASSGRIRTRATERPGSAPRISSPIRSKNAQDYDGKKRPRTRPPARRPRAIVRLPVYYHDVRLGRVIQAVRLG